MNVLSTEDKDNTRARVNGGSSAFTGTKQQRNELHPLGSEIASLKNLYGRPHALIVWTFFNESVSNLCKEITIIHE